MPVVCVRLSEEAVAEMERRAGGDRSRWMRAVLLRALGMARDSDAVEAVLPRLPAAVEPLVPGDRLRVVDPDSPVR